MNNNGEKIIRVAAVQMESKDGQMEANLEHATSLVNHAVEKGAKLILLPEFMPTGYLWTRAIWNAAEPKHGPTVKWLLENSERLGVWLGTSYLEADGEHFYNTFVLASPDGQEAGRGTHIIDTEFGKIGVGICYENSLAYLPELMYEQSAELVLMPHSAPSPSQSFYFRKKHIDMYNRVLKEVSYGMANALGVPVVMVNKSGRWQTPIPLFPFPFLKMDSTFPGFSAIVDSDGTIKSQLGPEEAIIVEDVTLDPSLKTGQRPRCYGRWAWDGPRGRSVMPFIEAFGRRSYSLSSERKSKARQISSANNDPRN